jgi:nitrate reductase NapE component
MHLLLAAFEATLVSLFSITIGLGPSWLLLFGVVLVGRAFDWLTTRLPAQIERFVLLAGAIVAVLLVVGRTTEIGIVALLPGSNEFGLAYLLLLVALFTYWRGTQLTSADSSSVSAHFGRGGGFIGLLLLLLSPLVGADPERTSTITIQILAFVALGLLNMALLTTATEQTAAQRMGWRWFATLALSILGLLAVGGLLIALLGGEQGLATLQQLLTLILTPIALVGAFLAWLFFILLGEPIVRLIRWINSRFEQPNIDDAPPFAEQSTLFGSDPGTFITGLAASATWIMALIPVIVLIGLVLLMQRRRRKPLGGDEQRVSLGLIDGLSSDLQSLLQGLRNPFARSQQGLLSALAALGRNDPTSRVRRVYVNLLLRLERERLARQPAETPHEFAQTAQQVIPQHNALETITVAYEQARYNPAGASEEEAALAEQALRNISKS